MALQKEDGHTVNAHQQEKCIHERIQRADNRNQQRNFRQKDHGNRESKRQYEIRCI